MERASGIVVVTTGAVAALAAGYLLLVVVAALFYRLSRRSGTRLPRVLRAATVGRRPGLLDAAVALAVPPLDLLATLLGRTI